MATLVTRCKQRVDKESDNSISSSEWKTLISEAFGELWGVVAESGLRYWEATQTFTADGSASYSEPSDMLALIAVDHLVDGTTTGTRRTLDEAMVQERDRWSGITGTARVYSLVDDQLYLWPTPASGTYEWRYIPQATDLASYGDSDAVDVVTPEGERFLIWCVAVKALAKSESDVSLALQERDQAKAALLEWATMRAFNNPRRTIVRAGDGTDWLGAPFDDADWWNR
jgi:hypothetical protein